MRELSHAPVSTLVYTADAKQASEPVAKLKRISLESFHTGPDLFWFKRAAIALAKKPLLPNCDKNDIWTTGMLKLQSDFFGLFSRAVNLLLFCSIDGSVPKKSGWSFESTSQNKQFHFLCIKFFFKQYVRLDNIVKRTVFSQNFVETNRFHYLDS